MLVYVGQACMDLTDKLCVHVEWLNKELACATKGFLPCYLLVIGPCHIPMF